MLKEIYFILFSLTKTNKHNQNRTSKIIFLSK